MIAVFSETFDLNLINRIVFCVAGYCYAEGAQKMKAVAPKKWAIFKVKLRSDKIHGVPIKVLCLKIICLLKARVFFFV